MLARVLKSSNAPRDCLFNRTVSYEDFSILDQKNLNGVHSIVIPSLFILPHLTDAREVVEATVLLRKLKWFMEVDWKTLPNTFI